MEEEKQKRDPWPAPWFRPGDDDLDCRACREEYLRRDVEGKKVSFLQNDGQIVSQFGSPTGELAFVTSDYWDDDVYNGWTRGR